MIIARRLLIEPDVQANSFQANSFDPGRSLIEASRRRRESVRTGGGGGGVNVAGGEGKSIGRYIEQATTSPVVAPRLLDILVLEDDDSTRSLLDALLGGLGHRVIGSRSVKEAKSLLTAFVFDLLLCDLSLPDGSGLELARHVPPGNKVYKIVISGYGDPEDIARSKAAGFDAHLVKPVDVGLLQREVWRLTGQPL